ncbi:cysteine synthase A [Haliovirga abyssi]|uniref:cysteine synthase n=1 Tax=Haliovirga abyssi TaxID=2996794 RepID=A0AAU9DD16_9FUSO|nr:cysteine synthase A [Haliovirga abyssi]BDU51235.1 cysteine synthase [Haliovirga abyssi]
MGKIYNNILELIGKTPIVKLNKINNGNAELYVKIESFNPGGCVKERIAFAMIKAGEKEGLIDKDTVIIEPTSGNTGIGLAMVCAVRGYRLILTMPDTMSRERSSILKAYGAEIVFTPGVEGMKGSINKAAELSKEYKNSFVPSQFENKANPKVHRETTGIEILNDMNNDIDIFVAGVGTGGTITGVGEALKEKLPNVKIVAVEPEGSPILSGGKPGPHKIQGIGAGFLPDVLNVNIFDEVFEVKNEDAFETMRLLAQKEGILAGISSGAAVYAAIEISKRAENSGKKIVVILPDTGERYLSMEIF